MCPRKDWFKEYKPIDDGEVLMGNNIACHVIGVRIISTKMFDGSIKILNAVR